MSAAAKLNENRVLYEAANNSLGIFVVSKILHLGVMLTDDAEINEALEAFLEDFDERMVKDLFGQEALRLLEFEEDELLPEFGYWCQANGKLGFVCLVEAPEVIRRNSSREVRYCIRKLRWFYGETLAEILQAADRWATSQEKMDAATPNSVPRSVEPLDVPGGSK